jgi:hypothetical protein
VANRKKVRGRRSRKRRPVAAEDPAIATSGQPPLAGGEALSKRASSANPRAANKRARPRGATARSGVARSDTASAGERPQAPWHPFPLAELLILIGLVAIVAGASKGSSGLVVLATGAGIVLLGTMEFSIREHLSGYRSHTILLAFLPTVMFHTAGVLLLAQVLGVSTAPSVIAPLVLDLPVFAFLFRLLRARYLDARRERTFAGRR